ncbi:phosphotransferase family protein [Variovorax sp. KBW07]|uniref:phosphotransferase family protein n=1 Tax=Variovorax sp. KBW07 TaxID=2153358 RepID=UPI000F5805A9|nr:aminoglycoside phosphotransferase family protein [Variovorax sp. KBW07]
MKKTKALPASILAALTRTMAGVAELVPLVEGEESQAFAFEWRGDGYVVRINREARGFEKDAFAARRFAAPGLPVPEVTAIGRLDEGPFYCVSRRAPGVTLQDLAPARLPAIVGPVAGVMDAIAASSLASTKGYGRFDADGIGEHASWHGFVTCIADEARFDWRPVAGLAGRAGMRRIDRHLKEVLALAAHCPETRQLVHGDFGANNVLTDGQAITGVIDWSEALFGDALYDVANIFFWRTWLDCMDQQARFFEAAGGSGETAGHGERLRCYQLRIGLQQVHECAVIGDAQDLAWALNRCDEIATIDWAP